MESTDVFGGPHLFPLQTDGGNGRAGEGTTARVAAVWNVRLTPLDKLVLIGVANCGVNTPKRMADLREFVGCTEGALLGALSRLQDAGYIA